MIVPILEALAGKRLEFTEALELLALAGGLKKVARFTGTARRLARLDNWLEALAWPHALAPFHLETAFKTGLGDRFSRIAPGPPTARRHLGVCFIGEASATRAAVDLEISGCPAAEAAKLYGYPACCAENYETEIQHGRPWPESFLSGTQGLGEAPWPLNRFGRLFSPGLAALPDYFPCRLHCAASLALAQDYLALLRDLKLFSLITLIQEHLSRPILHLAGVIHKLAPFGDWEPGREGPPLIVETLASWNYAGPPRPLARLRLAWAEGRLTAQALNEGGAEGEAEAVAALIRFN